MPEDELAGHERVGEGREAEVFAWDEGTVLRLLRRSSDPTRVEREAAAMRAAAHGGVDVPNVYGTTMVDGRAGLIMDRVDGSDLITLMGRRPWMVPHAARIVGHVREARASYVLTHRGRAVGVILPIDADVSTAAEDVDAGAAWNAFLRAGHRL